MHILGFGQSFSYFVDMYKHSCFCQLSSQMLVISSVVLSLYKVDFAVMSSRSVAPLVGIYSGSFSSYSTNISRELLLPLGSWCLSSGFLPTARAFGQDFVSDSESSSTMDPFIYFREGEIPVNQARKCIIN